MRSHSVPNAYFIYTAWLPCTGAPPCRLIPGRRTSQALLAGLCFLCSGLVDAALDPTRPPANLSSAGSSVASDHVAAPLVLQAVLRDAQGSRAMIGGQVLRVGDQHAGARILSIHHQSVWIERQGAPQLLRLVKPVMQPSR